MFHVKHSRFFHFFCGFDLARPFAPCYNNKVFEKPQKNTSLWESRCPGGKNNLAAALSEQGKRVLLCDFDPQANSTSGMGVDKTVSKGVYEVLIGEMPTQDALVHTKFGDVLPSNKALAGAGIELIGMERRESLLRDALAQVGDQYDFIFIDCPPSLELLTLNALCAADTILVPVQGEYFALEGLSDLMNTVRIVRRSLNPHLELEGVLLTMFDGRTNLALQVAQEVKHYFPGTVYSTVTLRPGPGPRRPAGRRRFEYGEHRFTDAAYLPGGKLLLPAPQVL